MFCSKCGADNGEGVKLCQSCSWVLAGGGPEEVNADAKTSGLAITALVLMILSFFTFCLTALPALICGIVSLVKIEKSGGKLKGKGYAIAGIAAPVVMMPIFIIAMLLAIMMPALGKTKVLAQRLVCGTNLRGLGNAMYVYSFDYDDTLPTGDKWCDLLMDEADVGAKSLVCPSGSPGECHYAMNENAIKLDASMLSDMVLLFEVSAPGWNLVGGREMLSTENHNGDGCNVLFGDGHMEFVRSGEIDRLRWSADEDETDVNY